MNSHSATIRVTLVFSTLVLCGMLVTGCIASPPILPAEVSTIDATSETLVDKIYQQLDAGEQIVEIGPVDLVLPDDIEAGQIGKYFQLGPLYFAVALKQSMNVPLTLPEGHVHSFTGLLSSEDGASWTKFLEIKDIVSTDKNNPYYLWSDEGALFLSVVDQNGGGSGEGVMKLETLLTDGRWKLADCFYFGGNYRGPDMDGDYFAFSRLVEQQKEQPMESCQDVELISHE